MKIAIASAVLFVAGSLTCAAGQISAKHPDGVLCKLQGSEIRPEGETVFYLSAVLVDGSALYQTLGNQVISLTFGPSGASLDNSSGICGGRSLSELVAAGRTFGS